MYIMGIDEIFYAGMRLQRYAGRDDYVSRDYIVAARGK